MIIILLLVALSQMRISKFYQKQVIVLCKANKSFNELEFFAQVKKRPGMFLGDRSLLSLRTHLFGMDHAFSFYTSQTPLAYFKLFIKWYHEEIINDLNGYACWWNHILYISGNNDSCAFDSFYNIFERYLRDIHNLCLPEVK